MLNNNLMLGIILTFIGLFSIALMLNWLQPA